HTTGVFHSRAKMDVASFRSNPAQLLPELPPSHTPYIKIDVKNMLQCTIDDVATAVLVEDNKFFPVGRWRQG
ncbi:hypothetical protein, partial [Mesorhizobium sp. M7A.F.Ca.CA.001.16.1.1]